MLAKLAPIGHSATYISLLLFYSLLSWAAETPKSDIQIAVEEFKIQTQKLGLRADSPPGTIRQRSSATTWHGRVYWNLRNDYLDAVPHQVRQTGGDKSILRRNQYGFNVSGPVYLPWIYHGGNKTFFSFSYEGMRETSGQQFLRTIATMPERGGDFSQTVDSSGQFLPIYDPSTTSLNPSYDPSQPVSQENLQYLREPFPGNKIDPGRLDSAALEALRYYPTPNVAIGPFFENNYAIYSPEVRKADGIRANLDHTVRTRQRLSLQLSYSDGFNSPAKIIQTIANSRSPASDSRNRGGQITHVFTISPSTINTARFSASINISERKAGVGNDGQAFPVLDLDSYLNMGTNSPVSLTARTNYYFSNGLTMRQGDHSLSFNGRWNLTQANYFLPRYPSGRFNFSSGLTSLPGIVNTGHAFGSFLLGMAEYAEQSLIEQPSYFRRQYGNFQLKDEWQLSPAFTLTLGLGMNVDSPRVEKYDRHSTVTFDEINPENGLPGAVVFASRGGRKRSFQPLRFGLNPWISFAWSPGGDARTVIRMSVERWRGGSYSVGSGHWGTQGFIGTPTFISENSQLEPAVIFEDGLPSTTHLLPDLRPDVANDTNADLTEMTGRTSINEFASFSVERQLPGSLVVRIHGTYNQARNRFVYSSNGAQPNAIPLEALKFRDLLNEESFLRNLRPYPQYRDFNVQAGWPVGRYSRAAANLRVGKRTSQGLSLQFSYTFSKQMDDYNTNNGLQDYYNRRNEWALSTYSSPHTMNLNYMYELPLGPNKLFLNATDWRRHLFQGWLISGNTRFSTGEPISLRAEFNNTGGVVEALYVNAVSGVDPHVPNPSAELWFNPNAFINPPDFTIGNVSRTHPTLRNPSSQNHDLAVTKRFTTGSGQSLEFIATALNFLNHANWNEPDSDIGTEDSPNTNAGRIIGSSGGRVMQLGLMFTF